MKKDRLLEECPICGQVAVYIDMVVEHLDEKINGQEVVRFIIEPGIISCTKCMSDLELSVHECGRHRLRPL